MLVDTNWHVIAPPAERSRYPLRPIPGTEGGFSEDQTTTADDCLALMDAAGVDRALVIGSRFHGFDNSYCAHAVAAHPDRLAGAANLDVSRDDAAAQLAHWVDGHGMHGVRLWNGRQSPATWVDDPRHRELWAEVERRALPVNAHTTTPAALPATRRLLTRFPGLRLVVNHLGHVPTNRADPDDGPLGDLLALAPFDGVRVNLPVEAIAEAARSQTPQRRVLDLLLAAFGAERLLWSAFYPSRRDRTYPESVALLRRSVGWLNAECRDQLLGRSAAALYSTLCG